MKKPPFSGWLYFSSLEHCPFVATIHAQIQQPVPRNNWFVHAFPVPFHGNSICHNISIHTTNTHISPHKIKTTRKLQQAKTETVYR